jgi:ornithine cyclodeaminase/alanine dehydrogenase-like protein (mu-crystallin family)
MDVQTLIKEKRILYISRVDLIAAGLLDYVAVVDYVREGLCMHTKGETINEKLALDFDVNKDWKISALIGVVGPYAGVKWLGANTDNAAKGLPRSNSIIALNHKETGRVLCMMDGAMISALRTGAYAALAAEAFMPQGPGTVGLIGAGVIARTVLLCLKATVRERISEVLVYDIRPESSQRFAALMAEKTGLPVRAVDTAAELMRLSDLSISATTAMEPFIRLEDVKPASTHVHLGGWEDEKTYVVACAQPPNKLLCDDIELVLHRDVQTVAFAYHDGLIGLDDFYGTLGEVLVGRKKGREGDELVYFNAVGLPVLDVCVALRLFESALASNLGVLLGSQSDHWILNG